MNFINFPTTNVHLVKPETWKDEECEAIYARKDVDDTGRNYFLVALQPSPEDIKTLTEGGALWVKVVGESFQPIAVFTVDNKTGELNP